MTPGALPRETRLSQRWIVLAAGVFVVQWVALVLLGSNHAADKKVGRPAPVMVLAKKSQAALALENPTLFALPTPRAFSGEAWLKVPAMTYQSPDWSEPQRWLELRGEDLGNAFRQLIHSNEIPSPVAQKIEPEYALPRLPSAEDEWMSRSSFRVEDELARRRLLSHFQLRSWTNAAPLTNSVVQLWVDATGFAKSATLLASSGFKEADDAALALSKAARFEPLSFSESRRNPGKLSLGQIIFEWQTTLSIATNKF